MRKTLDSAATKPFEQTKRQTQARSVSDLEPVSELAIRIPFL
jgi:hypothetical protein